jgi:hypothetical protein
MRLAVICLGLLAAVLVHPAAHADTQLTMAAGRADYPDYRIDGAGNMHLIRYDGTVDNGAILYKMFSAAGTELIPDIQVNDSSGSANTQPVAALDASSRLFVVWQDQADQEVWLMRLEPLLDDLDPATPADLLTIKAQTLSNNLPEVRISDPGDPWPARNPAVAIDGNGDLHVVWESGAGGPVQYVKVDPDGVLLNGPLNLGANGSGSDLPDIAIDSAGNVHVVYTHAGTTQANEVYYAMLDGATAPPQPVLIAPTPLTADEGFAAGSATVSVDLADDRVYVVYKQATSAAGSGAEQIYLAALDPARDDRDGSMATLAAIRLHETVLSTAPAQSSWRVFSRIGFDRRVHAIYMDFDATNCTAPNFTSADYTINNVHVTYDGKIIARQVLTDSGATPGCTPRARIAPRSNRVVWSDSATGDLEIFSAVFSRADAGSSGFTCSLGNPAAGASRAADLWLLLAFIAVLWRLRARGAG